MKNVLETLGASLPVASGDRSARLIDLLSSAIALGLLQTGDKLPPENQLADMLDVSIPTLREALAELRADGVIETRRGRGGGSFLVDSPQNWQQRGTRLLERYSVADLRDLGDEASALLGRAAGLAAERANAADIRRLKDMLRGTREATSEDQAAINNSRFHIELAVISQSMYLTQATVQMQSRLAPLLRASPRSSARMDSTHRAHEEIVEAIQMRRTQWAAVLAGGHLDGAIRKIIADKMATLPHLPERGVEQVAAVLEEYFTDLSTFLESEASQVEGLVRADSESERILTSIHAHATATLDRFESAAGAGPIFDVSPEGQGGDCLYWWIRSAPGLYERRLMDTVAGTEKFYDFRSNPWFQQSQERRVPVLQGPYIDYLGYDAYLVTVTAPMLGTDGDFHGVFGVDLELGSLEQAFLPLLRSVPGSELVLADASARVILASSSRWSSGQRIDQAVPGWSVMRLAPESLGLQVFYREAQAYVGAS
ncbi:MULTISPECIES: GntR family transcriptional regulator [Micrococcaceae]|uniref:GntR family transcriptional regulator n=1 Tax=Micrococcaceae TaxID=1268 RepID=UPI002A80DA62|nr:GntR family transcriptional regulator [Glutamicibacter protophormiae]WPR64451.1 GntR family transcriptional regulator [Glutamicibacter protophormiae]WPR67945.1 GntR family transcriptional regulator [Glutamicibacter protophormiae]